MDRKNRPVQSTWLAVVPFTLALMACAVPWLLAHAPQIGLALQRAFALVCHQQAERSFALFGGSVAVCSRCLGIFVGAAAGWLVRVQAQLARRLFALAMAVSLADWLAEASGLHGNWLLTRFLLGCAVGAAGAMLITSATGPLLEVSRPSNSLA